MSVFDSLRKPGPDVPRAAAFKVTLESHVVGEGPLRGRKKKTNECTIMVRLQDIENLEYDGFFSSPCIEGQLNP